ncbi:unnamed protein product [Xylocopa violacea]|uniref:C2H2-type domain-containing protein n=1 Tax=Xylocopa violacea TaxID=135666 RepID=A0ABP1NKC7_XYLVO
MCCVSREAARQTIYPCRVCGKIYSRKSSMYTHLRLCGKEPKFNCVLCGRRFNQLAEEVDVRSMWQTLSVAWFLEESYSGGVRQRTYFQVSNLR